MSCLSCIYFDFFLNMRREVGGGFRMGNTCTIVADSCQCVAKPIQYCKVKKKERKKYKKYIYTTSKYYFDPEFSGSLLHFFVPVLVS